LIALNKSSGKSDLLFLLLLPSFLNSSTWQLPQVTLSCPLYRHTWLIRSPAESTATLYSLLGKQLKLDDAASIQPYLDQIHAIPDLEEVRFGGNTLGIEACEALAKTLESKKNLKVSPPTFRRCQRDRASGVLRPCQGVDGAPVALFEAQCLRERRNGFR
jgi:hypothetical protein